MVPFESLNHVTVVIADLEKSKHFYGKLMGLKKIKRPNFPFQGIWYSLKGQVALHLIVNKKRTPRWKVPSKIEICYPHFALWVDDTDKVVRRLQKSGIKYFEYLSSPTQMRQIFVYDPDGNMLELIGN